MKTLSWKTVLILVSGAIVLAALVLKDDVKASLSLTGFSIETTHKH